MDWLVFLAMCQAIAVISHLFVIVDYSDSFSKTNDRLKKESEKLVFGFMIAAFVSFMVSVLTQSYYHYLEVTIVAHVLSLLLNHYRYSITLSDEKMLEFMRLGNCLFIIGTCISSMFVK